MYITRDRASVNDLEIARARTWGDTVSSMDYSQIIRLFLRTREDRGLRQADVAKDLGISVPSLSHYEREERRAHLGLLQRWAKALKLNLVVEIVRIGETESPMILDLSEEARRLESSQQELLLRLAVALQGSDGERGERLLLAALDFFQEDDAD